MKPNLKAMLALGRIVHAFAGKPLRQGDSIAQDREKRVAPRMSL